MKRLIACIIVAVGLSPCVATGKTLCIQLDTNGDVLVLKGLGKGSKALSGSYLADFVGGSTYTFRPLTGSSIMSSSGDLAAGLTQYGISINSFQELTVIHRVRCFPGSDGKLGELDACTDTALTIGLSGNSQSFFPGHVIPCLAQFSIP